MRLILLFLISSLIYGVSCKNNVKALTESLGQEVIEIGNPIKGLPPDIDEEPSAEVDDEDKVSTTSQPSPGTKRDIKKTATTLDTRRRGKDIDKIDNTQEDEEARIEKELAEIYKDTEYKDGVSDLPKKEEIANYTEQKSIARSRNKNSARNRHVLRFSTKHHQHIVDSLSPTRQPAPLRPKTFSPAFQANTLYYRLRADRRQPYLIGYQDETNYRCCILESFKFQPDLKDKQAVERFRTSNDEISCERSATKKLVLQTDVKKSVAVRFNEDLIILGLVSIAAGIFR